jgi:cobalamin biosynthesis Co2+ chelatase CbiK
MSLEMKAVVLNKLQQMTGDPNYGKTCYNDTYDKTNGESVRRLKIQNWDVINETNFKQFQDAIAALSNDQFRVELDRLNYRTDYRQIVVRIITLVQQPQQPVVETPTNTITVFAPSGMEDQIATFFNAAFSVHVVAF